MRFGAGGGIRALVAELPHVKRLVVVEASDGQLEVELRLALSKAGVHAPPPIDHIRRYGGCLPQQRDIVERALAAPEVLS